MNFKQKVASVFTACAFSFNVLSPLNFIYADAESVVPLSYNVNEKKSESDAEMLEKALDWLISSQNENGSFNSTYFQYNSTCEALSVLRNNAGMSETEQLEDLLTKADSFISEVGYSDDFDRSCRYFMCCSNADSEKQTEFYENVLKNQNADGGFGLTARYDSDVLDSLLVLETLNYFGTSTVYDDIKIRTDIVKYLTENMTESGWGYTSVSDVDSRLTAMAIYNISRFQKDAKTSSDEVDILLEKACNYLNQSVKISYEKSDIEQTLYTLIALQEYNGRLNYKELVSGLSALQDENGSFFNDAHLTSLVIRLLGMINKGENLFIENFSSSLDNNIAVSAENSSFVLSYKVDYSMTGDEKVSGYSVSTVVTNGDSVIFRNDMPVEFTAEKDTLDGTVKFSLAELTDNGIIVKSELKNGNEIIAEDYKVITLTGAQSKDPFISTYITDCILELSDYTLYTGYSKEVMADFGIIYTSNSDQKCDMHFTVEKNGEIVDENTVSAGLDISKNYVKGNGISFTPDTTETGVYKITAECIFNDNVLFEKSIILNVVEYKENPDSNINVQSIFPIMSDAYVYAGHESSIELGANVGYCSNRETEGHITVKAYKGDDIIAEETASALLPEGILTSHNSVTNYPYYMDKNITSVTVSETGIYRVTAELFDSDDNLIASGERTITVADKPTIEDVVLKTAVNDDGGLDLRWNDISNEAAEYNYTVMRSANNKEYSGIPSRKITDIKVLNVHKNNSSLLKKWFEMPIEGTNVNAGKGIFSVDGVNVSEFNIRYDEFLFGGNYDIIYFGTNDGGFDIGTKAADSLERYINDGGAVLFSHDTIWGANHPNFLRFTDYLGLVSLGESQASTNTVSVLKKGRMTYYPWSLSGTYEIGNSHSSGIYAGGDLPSTVWSDINIDNAIDEETGAHSNFYLATNGRLGYINLGHSIGDDDSPVTDGERMILADALFGLVNEGDYSSVTDNSYGDITPPEKPFAELGESDSNIIPLTLKTKDLPTEFSYYVQAVPVDDSDPKKISNICNETAFADMQGYVVEVNSSPELSPELIAYDETGKTITNIISAEGDKEVTIDVEIPDRELQHYIHVFAVDNANNISEEVIIPVIVGTIHAEIDTDKKTYSAGETVRITGLSKAVQSSEPITAYCDMYIIDAEGNKISVITEKNKNVLSSVYTKGDWYPSFIQGDFKAVIDWFDSAGNKITTASTDFSIVSSNEITNNISTDRQIYYVNEPVNIIDKVMNSGNIAANELTLDIEIVDENSEKAAAFNCNINSILANNDYSYKNVILPNTLKAGKYTVNAKISDRFGDITENTKNFTVIDKEQAFTKGYTADAETVDGFYFSHDPKTFKTEHITLKEISETDSEGNTKNIEFDESLITFVEKISGADTPEKAFKEDTNIYTINVLYNGQPLMDKNGKVISFTAYIGVKGDTNFDNKVNAVDASNILSYYSKLSTTSGDKSGIRLAPDSCKLVNDNPELDVLAAFLADVDKDVYSSENWKKGKLERIVDARDASSILSFYAYVSTTQDVELNDIWNKVLSSQDRAGQIDNYIKGKGDK